MKTYARVSNFNKRNEGQSLDNQIERLAFYAKSKGLEVTEVFADKDVSASVPLEKRKQGRRLLASLKKGDTVIATKLDRVFRNSLDALQTVERFKKKGVELHLLDLGGSVTSGGVAQLFFTMLAAFAEFERERIGERIKESKARNKLAGNFLGGDVPFGYDLVRDEDKDEGKLILNPFEQQVIEWIRKQKGSLRSIKRTLFKEHEVSLAINTIRKIRQ